MNDICDGGMTKLRDGYQERRVKRMAVIDNMKPELRELVNEYGLYVVQSMLDCGITKPRQIKNLVEVVLNEFSPSRGSSSFQGSHRGQPS